MRIRPFEIERFYERWEFRAELMLSSSDCETRTVAQLLEVEPGARERLLDLRLGYTEVPGSQALRTALAALYERTGPDELLALAAAEEGIFLAYHALIEPGEHVVVEAPCYGSAIEVARSAGADVGLWQRRYEDAWAYDVDALERLLRPETRLIYINTPHNPTGSQMPREVFDRVLGLARERSAVLFCDEVYRGLEHDAAERLPAACDAYERAVSLGTVSKAHGLPGLRIGWVACRDAGVLRRMRELKLYTTICSSAPSEVLVEVAARHSDELVGRSRELVLANLALVQALIERRSGLLQWMAPRAGPIGFPAVSGVDDVRAWCERIARESGVLLLPGDVYAQPRHIRLGFGRAEVPRAIERLEAWLDRASS